ncbi:MAG: homoserine dehydrogenase [Bacteroidota bacterium]
MSNQQQLTIGLFGFGVVGEGIYQVLQQTPSLNASIKTICIKHADKERNAPTALFTTDENSILDDPEINVIVELIDDADAAYRIVKKAFANKKAIVSANKKMIAEHLEELLKIQKEHAISFLYEAAVCGSIPVIRNLEEYYDNDLLSSFSGIVNGSTNYILTKMSEDKLDFATALKQAQDLGFAESNPALDIEGIDAVNKLSIVLKHAYGITCLPSELIHRGINRLHPIDSIYAGEKGLQIKLVANAKHTGEQQIAAYVLPAFVNKDSQLYHVRNEFNGTIIGSKLADEQFLYGKGAGRFPTSSAVLSDIAALRYGYKYEYKKSDNPLKYTLSYSKEIKVYLSFNAHCDINRDDFTSIEESYSNHKRHFLIAYISLDKLNKATWLNNQSISLIVFNE